MSDGGRREAPVRVAVFDLDGTISRRDLFLVFLMQAARRLGPARKLRTALLPLHTLRFGLRAITNSDLKAAYLDAILGGRPRSALAALAADFAAHRLAHELKPAALQAMQRHRQAGDALLLASASLDLYVEPIAARLGFDAVVSTRVAWTAEDRLAGSLDGDNLRGAPKLAAVRALLAKRFPTARDFVAYSDHESDIPLLAAAGSAVAVDPTATLRRVAHERGWAIVDWRGTGRLPVSLLNPGEDRCIAPLGVDTKIF
ncbi:HAD family hydrolase [Falsiroseomonas tokyonensis]|uniref:HAD family hydrolase n=1 Tax=Falsiroseomonas tokyonensis TaxID=430521 RepID=A0ABV7C581_9PROT|nr:HAD-IB family hydrolase [Falsiroseomonas tokyonensis]MBU8541461.1 HAD-IB family hydrolase [Falsiroseomonas tokyonensis]